jgi:uncharacterized protein (TIRG00374 family)
VRGAGKGDTIRRSTWKWLAAGVLALAGLVWLVRSQLSARTFDWKLLAGTLGNLHWQWLALAVVPAFASYYGRALRWAVFLRPLKPRPSITNLFGATVIGFAAITLFGRPGEFVRPYLIARKEQVPVPSQLAAWFLERMFDLLMALAVFGFALTQIHTATVRVGPNLTWVLAMGGRIVGILSGAVLFMLLAMRHFAEPFRCWLIRMLRFLPERHFQRFERLITTFAQGVESTRSDGALFLVFLYSIAEWALFAGCFWCVAQAYAGTINLTFVDVLIFMGFVSFGSTVQIPGIGGGAQVVAVLVLTELFGTKLELATSFAIFVWILSFVVVVPVGLIWALTEGLNWRKLRDLGQEASQ